MPWIFACLELLNVRCRSLLSEYFFLKLLSFSESSVVWTPKTCVMVEIWLNRLNSTARLWNLSNWVAHMDVRLKFGLYWLRKFTLKKPCAFGIWIGHSLLALTAFKRKSWKRWSPSRGKELPCSCSTSSRAFAPCCSPCPDCFSSLPGLLECVLLQCLGKWGFTGKMLSFPRESLLCMYSV